MEYSYRNELYHHGILGQKWGVRRFQNKDGTLTSVGKTRHKDRVEARNRLSSEKKKLSELEKKKWDIESEVEYSDDIYDLLLNARDGWDDKKNRPLSDKEVEANWAKYEKAYKKALSEHKDYTRIVKEVETKKATVKELESVAKTKDGKDYLSGILSACATVAVTSAAMLAIDYVMTHK